MKRTVKGWSKPVDIKCGDEFIIDGVPNELHHPNCRCITPALEKLKPRFEEAVRIALGREVQKITKDIDTRSTIECGDGVLMPGLRRMGEIKLEGVFGDTRENLLRAWMDPLKHDKFKVEFPGGELFEFQGHVTSVHDTIGGGAQVCIRPIRPITKEKKKMHPKKMREGLKRFYIGSNSLTPDWTHASLKDAEAHATKLIDRDGYEDVFIVEIKRVVRRKKQPVVSEPFKGSK